MLSISFMLMDCSCAMLLLITEKKKSEQVLNHDASWKESEIY